jgi:hypothetical protein
VVYIYCTVYSAVPSPVRKIATTTTLSDLMMNYELVSGRNPTRNMNCRNHLVRLS